MTKAELHRLDNGVRIVLAPCEAESTAFGVFVASGSRYEKASEAGVSHFIEHMLFKGTPSRKAADITREIEGCGGNFNAMTGEESTCYYAHVPSEHLGRTVEILGDMYANAALEPGEFEREKRVVLEEIKMYSDEPDAVAMENLQRAAFPGNPLGRPVAGSAKTLEPMTPNFMRTCMRRHYRSDNTILVTAGAFDPASALRTMEKAFGSASPPRSRHGFVKVDFTVPPEARVEAKKDVHQVQTALGYRTRGLDGSPRRRLYALSVLDALLGRGMSSRLFTEVREKRGLCYDISSHLQMFRDAALWTVATGTDPAKAEKALSTIDRETAKIAQKGPGRAELARVKEFLTGNFRMSHENVKSKMFFHGSTLISFGRLVDPQEQVDGIKAVSAEDIVSVARELFRPENRSVSIVSPAG